MMRLQIRSGICKCGHSWKEHHLGMIINKIYMDECLKIDPNYPPYVAQECEHYGFNEMGGLDSEGNYHCSMYEDDPEPCPAGCIFYRGYLQGDCRAPSSTKCFLNQQRK